MLYSHSKLDYDKHFVRQSSPTKWLLSQLSTRDTFQHRCRLLDVLIPDHFLPLPFHLDLMQSLWLCYS